MPHYELRWNMAKNVASLSSASLAIGQEPQRACSRRCVYHEQSRKYHMRANVWGACWRCPRWFFWTRNAVSFSGLGQPAWVRHLPPENRTSHRFFSRLQVRFFPACLRAFQWNFPTTYGLLWSHTMESLLNRFHPMNAREWRNSREWKRGGILVHLTALVCWPFDKRNSQSTIW